jgi:hypothetical protein
MPGCILVDVLNYLAEKYLFKAEIKNRTLSRFLDSAMTFRTCRIEKLTFILLNWLDLSLTMFAMTIGATELNPLMRQFIGSPMLMYAVKIVIPMFFAWALPGKILIPSIGLLVLVVIWNLKELIVFFF